MSITCVCCGKVWDSESRHVDGEHKHCSNRVTCITRALGPTPAKTYARTLRQKTAPPPKARTGQKATGH